MKKTWFGWNRGHGKPNRALTGYTFCANHQLCRVGSAGIGDETGIRRCGILQFGITGIGFRGERPEKAQRFRRCCKRSVAIQRDRLAHPHCNDRPRSGDSAGNGCRRRVLGGCIITAAA